MSKQLTREEAIEAAAQAVPSRYRSTIALDIDVMIAVGVFTPVEPKTIDDEVVDALKGNWGAPRNIIADIKAAGFKIVKA